MKQSTYIRKLSWILMSLTGLASAADVTAGRHDGIEGAVKLSLEGMPARLLPLKLINTLTP